MRRTVRDCARDYLSEFGSESFLGENFVSVAIILCADAGAGTVPFSTMSVAVIFFPYTSSLAPLSGRSVEPSSETPANRPREREYVSISARKVTLVSALASRPLGPATAENVGAEFYFGVKNGACSAWVHQENYESSSLRADLKSEAPALQSHHCRWAPFAREMRATAACHRSAAVCAAARP